MSSSFIVKLPPEDTLLRDLAFSSFLYMRERCVAWGIDLRLAQDSLILGASSDAPIIDAFRTLFLDAAKVAEERSNRVRIGILRNDQQILARLIGEKPEGLTYLDAIARFLKACASSDIELASLSQVRIDGKGITLGKGVLSALNFLTSERYEYGLEFWKLNYKFKLHVELDKMWYALILAGFAFAASAFTDNELLLIYLPEDFIHSAYVESRIHEAIRSNFDGLHNFHRKAGDIIYEEWCSVEPYPAFLLLLSLNIAKVARDVNALYILGSLPLALCRIRRTGNVFTMIEKKRANIFELIRFATKLAKEEKSIDELIYICRRTIQLKGKPVLRKGEATFSDHNRFCTLLVQAIQGAFSPYEVVYYGARYLSISKELLRAILNAIIK